MKLSVEYVRPKLQEGEIAEQDIQTTINLITYAIGKQYPDGIDGNGPVRRMYGRLQRKMDAATEDESNVLDLEQSEVDMITKAVSEAKYPAGLARLVMQLEDALYNKATPEPEVE